MLGLDFVAGAANASVGVSLNGRDYSWVSSSSLAAPNLGGFAHQAALDFSGVAAGAAAHYKITVGDASSGPFVVVPVPARAAPVVAIFADFGFKEDESMAALTSAAASGAFDVACLVGDHAYDFQIDSSSMGNNWMNAMQAAFTASRPLQPAAGNHEMCSDCGAVDGLQNSAGNFSEYRLRYHAVTLANAATSASNIFYSFNVGLTHFIVFSAEAYIYARSAAFLANQLAFMRADLAAVDRRVFPWVVALCHKDYTMQPEAFKDFAPILEAGAVDVMFVGHVHYYVRSAPYEISTGRVDAACVSNGTSGGFDALYSGCKFMTTIVNGAAGNKEGNHACGPLESPQLACSSNFGFGLWQATDKSSATWRWQTAAKDKHSKAANFTDSVRFEK